MNKDLLNQFIDVIKKKYDNYLVYVDELSYGKCLIVKGGAWDYEIHIDTLYMQNLDDFKDPIMDDIRNIYLQFHREHLLNILL